LFQWPVSLSKQPPAKDEVARALEVFLGFFFSSPLQYQGLMVTLEIYANL
jgi:hypothetical protein